MDQADHLLKDAAAALFYLLKKSPVETTTNKTFILWRSVVNERLSVFALELKLKHKIEKKIIPWHPLH